MRGIVACARTSEQLLRPSGALSFAVRCPSALLCEDITSERQYSHETASTSSVSGHGQRGPRVSSITQPAAAGWTSRAAASFQSGVRTFCRWLKETTPINVPNPLPTLAVPPAPVDVMPSRNFEVGMDAQLVFESCWRRFEEKYQLKAIHVPREVVWLNGAPGSGKGANTRHILSTRGLDHSICLSTQLMAHPDAHGYVERGDMIPDALVGDVLLEQLLIHSCQTDECGVLVDGFPRTPLQVDFLKLLADKMFELHQMFSTTVHRDQFPRSLFKVVMLYVDEETSIQRQLERARIASVVNKRIQDACAGELREQRSTDLSIEICRKRYSIFRSHYSAIMRLKQFFPFHLIDAMGTLSETQEAITTELRYQSSLDLSEYTYSAIRHLPLARDLADHARQHLVQRLEKHAEKHEDVFQRVVELITADIMPILQESGLAGNAIYVSENRLFSDYPRAAQILIDVLTDRGFSVSHASEVTHIPTQIDLQTGSIKCRRDVRHRFTISWDVDNVRDMAKAMEMAARMAEVSVKNVRISKSFIPNQYAVREMGRGNGLSTIPVVGQLGMSSAPLSASTSQVLHRMHAHSPKESPISDFDDVIYGS